LRKLIDDLMNKSMGIKLPETPKPVAAYIPALKVDKLVFTSGQIPVVKGELKYRGKLGAEISKEQGFHAAQICVLNALSAVRDVVGSLDNIEQIVKLVGFVASAENFKMFLVKKVFMPAVQLVWQNYHWEFQWKLN